MKRYLILFCILLGGVLQAEEIRALWVLPWNIKTPQAIDTIIDEALLANQNELLVEVRYRSDALYTPNRLSTTYYNPEPRSYILDSPYFDPLAYLLEKAHAEGLRVQAWVVVFNATPLDSKLLPYNVIYRDYRDWLTYDQNGHQMHSGEQFGYFVDPGIPAVQNYLLDVFSDLVDSYPALDGLHLDYVRYPAQKYGYHPESIRRMRLLKEEEELSFNEWRIRQVTEFMEKLRQRMREIKPGLILSAAVISDVYEAKTLYGQDWLDWLNRDLIDLAYPMTYHVKWNNFIRQLDAMEAGADTRRIVIGLRAWNAKGGSLLASNSPAYNINHIKDRILHIRQKDYAGITLFSYDGIMQGGAFKELSNMVYQAPAAIPHLQNGANNLAFYRKNGVYTLECILPYEGRWFWDLHTPAGESLYHSYQYFYQGFNQDEFLGSLADGGMLPKGSYTLKIYLPENNAQYQIPIIIEDLPFE